MDTSKTSRNHLPAIFRRVAKYRNWREGSVNFDIGGGRFNKLSAALAGRRVENIIYDPYARSAQENHLALRKAIEKGVDTVTISNVLNVIKSPRERLRVLDLARRLCRGSVYITVYEGNKSGHGRKTRDGWQSNRRLASYKREVDAIFGSSVIYGGMIIAFSA